MIPNLDTQLEDLEQNNDQTEKKLKINKDDEDEVQIEKTENNIRF